DDNIRPLVPHDRDGVVPGRGLARDLHAVGLEDGPEGGSHQGLIVDEDDTYGHAFGGVVRIPAVTAKPPSAVGGACNVPPKSAIRSRMPMSPRPVPAVPARAGPGSRTSMRTSVSPMEISTRASV